MLNEVIVARYLDIDEASTLKATLERSGIRSILQVMPGDLTDPNYQVVIRKLDVDRATRIINEFRLEAKRVVEERKGICPKCKAREPFIISPHLSFWKRIISMGAKPMKCLKCGNNWYV